MTLGTGDTTVAERFPETPVLPTPPHIYAEMRLQADSRSKSRKRIRGAGTPVAWKFLQP